jgi:rod shape-determining protein MreB
VQTLEVKGRHLPSGTSKILSVDSEEVCVAISEQLENSGCIKIALEQTPPELSAEIAEHCIPLTGGVRCSNTLINCHARRPICLSQLASILKTVVLGSGEVLDKLDLLKERWVIAK